MLHTHTHTHTHTNRERERENVRQLLFSPHLRQPALTEVDTPTGALNSLPAILECQTTDDKEASLPYTFNLLYFPTDWTWLAVPQKNGSTQEFFESMLCLRTHTHTLGLHSACKEHSNTN